MYFRLNERILSTKNSKFIDLTGSSEETLSSVPVESFAAQKAPEMTATLANSCRYITTKNDLILRPLTVWIVGDFDTYEGRAILLEGVKYLVCIYIYVCDLYIFL